MLAKPSLTSPSRPSPGAPRGSRGRHRRRRTGRRGAPVGGASAPAASCHCSCSPYTASSPCSASPAPPSSSTPPIQSMWTDGRMWRCSRPTCRPSRTALRPARERSPASLPCSAFIDGEAGGGGESGEGVLCCDRSRYRIHGELIIDPKLMPNGYITYNFVIGAYSYWGPKASQDIYKMF